MCSLRLGEGGASFKGHRAEHSFRSTDGHEAGREGALLGGTRTWISPPTPGLGGGEAHVAAHTQGREEPQEVLGTQPQAWNLLQTGI